MVILCWNCTMTKFYFIDNEPIYGRQFLILTKILSIQLQSTCVGFSKEIRNKNMNTREDQERPNAY